jgi:2-polyprenyl-3-methyl-5-hydroxy-6-metoxy-1,4-benzoquinol methylase
MIECLLCKSKKINNIQKIDTQSIINLYKEKLNTNTQQEFKTEKQLNAYECKNCHLTFFSPIIAGSEEFYETLQLKSEDYYSDERKEFSEAINFIKNTDRVLEIGAGSAFFAEKLDNPNYVGLEYNQEAIDKAKVKGINLVKQSIEEFAKNNAEQFDVVCSFHVLEHVPNPFSYIENSLKTLKKGGKFICAVPCSDSYYISNLNHVLNMPPHHVTRWKIKTLYFVCENFNLSIDYFYNDKVLSPKNYLEVKVPTVILKFLFPKRQIVVSEKVLTYFDKIFKKLNRTLNLYKLFGHSGNKGNNMLIVATKK